MKNIFLLLIISLSGCAYDQQAWQQQQQFMQTYNAQQQQNQQRYAPQPLLIPPPQPYYIPPIQQPVDVNVHIYDGGGLPTSR
jgi:hypothetical protein